MEIHDLTLRQGATWDIDIAITGPGGLPMDLTDYQVRSMMRTSSKDVEPKAAFVCSKLDVNTIRLHLSAVLTAATPSGKYKYDVEIYKTVNEEEIVYAPTSGIIMVTAEITK